MKIKTTIEDMIRARELIEERNEFKKAHGGEHDWRVDQTRSSDRLEYFGMLAEIVVAKLLKLEVNKELLIGGDGGVDLIWHGKLIQIKHSFYPNGRLIVRTAKQVEIGYEIKAQLFFIARPTVLDSDKEFQVQYVRVDAVRAHSYLFELQAGTGKAEVLDEKHFSDVGWLTPVRSSV